MKGETLERRRMTVVEEDDCRGGKNFISVSVNEVRMRQGVSNDRLLTTRSDRPLFMAALRRLYFVLVGVFLWVACCRWPCDWYVLF